MRTGPTSEVSCPRFFCAQHLKQMYDGKWCYGRQPGSSLQVLQDGAQNQEEQGPRTAGDNRGARNQERGEECCYSALG